MFSRLSRGQRLLFAGHFDRAVELLGRAAEASPGDASPRLYRAVALGWLSRREEAADEAARAASLARRPAPTGFLAALFAADAGRYDPARDLLAQAEKDDPRNPYGAGIRAFIALREGDGGVAVRRLLAIDLPPNDEYMLRVLRFLEEAKRPPVDPAPAQAAPTTPPGWRAKSDAARMVGEGVSLVEDEKYAQAVETLRKAVALAPEDATAHACLGEALFLAGDRAAAEQEFHLRNELARKDQMKTDEQSMLVEGYLGRIDYYEGRLDRALERLTRAVAAGSMAPDDRYVLGLCHWWRGNARDAYLSWVRIRRDDPDFLRRRLRELLGLPRGKPPGPFDWIGALRAPEEAVS